MLAVTVLYASASSNGPYPYSGGYNGYYNPYGMNGYSPFSNRYYNSPYNFYNQPVHNDISMLSTSVLAFNPDGSLDTTAPTATLITAIGAIAWADGASAQAIPAAAFRFIGTTQFALPSSVSQVDQDGSQSGILKGISIGTDGVITGQSTSGANPTLFRLALADFSNPQGLAHVGNSLYLASQESGVALAGSPGDGSFGTVLSGSLELSTVDLATEFVKMVTTQRGFQASSRTITVTDTLLKEVSNLKR